jgi:formylglycine-generating enzyme required for sulfatase activity
MNDPVSSDEHNETLIKLFFPDSLVLQDLYKVDLLRFTIHSSSVDEPIIQTVEFGEGRTPIEEIPAGIAATLLLEWLDNDGNVLSSGLFPVDSLNGDTIIITIVGRRLTPCAPSGIDARYAFNRAMIVTWEDNSHFESEYIVERAPKNSQQYARVGRTSNSLFIDTTVQPSGKYRYRVFGRNGAGPSPSIESGTVVAAAFDTVPPTVRILSHSNPDTVNQRILKLAGYAHDPNGIRRLWIGDTILTVENLVWHFEGYLLDEGDNVLTFHAEDNSLNHNDTTEVVHIHYDPSYTDTTNHPPFFIVSPHNLGATVVAGREYRRTLLASDTDEFNVLSIDVCDRLTLVQDSIITWSPSIEDTGTHTVWARVFDQDSASDSISWAITVADPRHNEPPEFTGTVQITDSVQIGETYHDTLTARDINQEGGLKFELTIDGEGGIVDSETGEMSWKPGTEDIGANLAIARVIDDSASEATFSWVITVYDPSSPVADAGEDTVVSINDTIMLHGRGIKQNGTITTFEWDVGNTGTFVQTASGDTTICAPRLPVKEYVCVLRVWDNTGKWHEDRIVITVEKDAPVVDAGRDMVVQISESFTLDGDVVERYGSIIKWEWKIGDEPWVETDSTRYTTQAPSASGSYRCFFRVTDDDGNVQSDFLTLWVIGTTMQFVDPGEVAMDSVCFEMGSQNGESDETPVHTVCLSPFFIDSTEVAQAEYEFVMNVNPSSFVGPYRPVEGVTWYDAVLYCNARSVRDGFDTVYSYTGINGEPGNGCTELYDLVIDTAAVGYHLPTEAQWEYLCKADTAAGVYPWGDGAAGAYEHSWFSLNASSVTHDVGEKVPNINSIYDLAGNVAEWCNDYYGEEYYHRCSNTAEQCIDPRGPENGIARVIRGGSWRDDVEGLRVSKRSRGLPEWSSSFVGFRCVLPSQ